MRFDGHETDEVRCDPHPPVVPRLLLRRRLLSGDRPLLPLVGSRIRVRALATNGKTAAVSETPVATDVHQPLDVHGTLGSKRTFHLEVALDLTAETVHVVVV